MNRFSRFALAVCTVGSMSTFALAAPAATPKAAVRATASGDQDIQDAMKSSGSLFKNPAARIATKNVGGHVAFVTKHEGMQTFNGNTRADVVDMQIEVADANGYHNGGSKKPPPAIRAWVDSDTVHFGHDAYNKTPSGTAITLTRVKGTGKTPVYRGSGKILGPTSAGDDESNAVSGDLNAKFAGANESWDHGTDAKGYSAGYVAGPGVDKP